MTGQHTATVAPAPDGMPSESRALLRRIEEMRASFPASPARPNVDRRTLARALMRTALRLDPTERAEDIGRLLREAFGHDPYVAADEAFYSLFLTRTPAFERGWQRGSSRSARPAAWDRATINATLYGLGDQIQWFRLLPSLSSDARRVLVKPELFRIAGGILGPRRHLLSRVDHNVWICGQTCDTPCGPTSALPLDLVPMLDALRMSDLISEPYIAPDADLASAWRPRIEAHGDGIRVGLVWASSRSGMAVDRGAERTIGLASLAPLAEIAGVRWFGFQKGANELDPAPAGMDLLRLGGDFGDFADTAAAMSLMDVIVSVDSSPAHLAGAIGVPTWLLLDREHDPRWPIGQPAGSDRTVWYPSVRLFRQQRAGDWAPVVARVASELRRLVAERGAA